MNAFDTLRSAMLAAALVAPLSGFAAADTFMNGQSVYGRPASSAPATRVVDLGSAASLNVPFGETVKFRGEGGKEFSWTFDGLDHRPVEISKIAPSGFTTKPMTIYVGRDPVNRN